LESDEPISDSALCHAMTFEIRPDSAISLEPMARAVRAFAAHFRLSGRLETYLNVGYMFEKRSGIATEVSMRKTPSDQPQLLSFGFVFRPTKGKNNHQGLEDMRDYLARSIKSELETLLIQPALFDPASFEAGSLGSAKASMAAFSFIALDNGAVRNLIEPQINPLA
jgi:hypothetical protein